MESPLVILVVGRPAAGKTATALRIVQRFGLPLLAKDAFKEILFDRLGAVDRAASVALGRAAFDVLDHAIEQQLRARSSFVVEAPYSADYEDAKFRAWQHRFGFRVLQVHCVASDAVLTQRFVERSSSGLRHALHADGEHVDEFRASLRDGRRETLSVEGETITLDVDEQGALEHVLDRVASALAVDGPKPTADLGDGRGLDAS